MSTTTTYRSHFDGDADETRAQTVARLEYALTMFDRELSNPELSCQAREKVQRWVANTTAKIARLQKSGTPA